MSTVGQRRRRPDDGQGEDTGRKGPGDKTGLGGPRVREVVNELQVTDKSSIKDVAKDLAPAPIAAADRRSDISSLNFSIDVVNGTVYLSGVAADARK